MSNNSSAAPLVIKNARIIDPATDRDFMGEVICQNGVFSEVTEGTSSAAPKAAQIIDAKGLILAPGLIDMQVHVGEPGHEYRETFQSAGEAAAAGGVTTFVCMPNTEPAIDEHALVDFVQRRAQAQSKVRILPAAAMTKGLEGKEITEFGLLNDAGAIALTDGRKSIQSAGLMKSIFDYAANFDMLTIHQPNDETLAGSGVMNAGLFATTLGLNAIPATAETTMLSRDLLLAQGASARYHVASISTVKSAQILREAKSENDHVSAGISINHLTLNELDIGQYRTFLKIFPPLRSDEERRELVQAIKDGTISVIHSSHDPQDSEVKRRPFGEAAAGAIGLETLLAATLRLVHDGSLPLMTALRALTSAPAEILGLLQGKIAQDAPADFILLDPDYPWVNAESDIRSRSKNTPFEGAQFTGKVMQTFVAGQRIFAHQE